MFVILRGGKVAKTNYNSNFRTSIGICDLTDYALEHYVYTNKNAQKYEKGWESKITTINLPCATWLRSAIS